MTKLYAIYITEQYRPAKLRTVTKSEDYAKWFCREANKCTDNYGVLYYTVYDETAKESEELKNLEFGFTFNLDTLEFESSEYEAFENEGVCIVMNAILVNGVGESYEEAKKNAEIKAIEIKDEIDHE